MGHDASMLPTMAGDAHLTSPGTTLGTVAYMSPEQARGEPLDAAAICSRSAWSSTRWQQGSCRSRARTSGVVFHEILSETPTPVLRLKPELPPEFDRIVTKALEKARDMRAQTAGELLADLKRLKRDLGSSHSVDERHRGGDAATDRDCSSCRHIRRPWLPARHRTCRWSRR